MSTKKQRNKPDEALDWHAIWEELSNTNANDRAAAIVGEAILDESLSRLLSSYFVENKDEVNRLVEYPGPLWRLSAKSSIAYCLGLITKGQLDELRAINKIRNHFAHRLHGASFKDQVVKEQMSKIEQYKRFLSSEADLPRKQFNIAVSVIAYSLSVKTTSTGHRQEIKDKSLTELLEELGSPLS